MTTIEQLYDLFVKHPVITTDSRDCPEGSIFFALKGEKFDGNQYALQALEKGCAYAVIDDASIAADKQENGLLLVDNVLTALQQLAQYHRRQLKTPVIGITGTNGKTTTKELIAAVLKKKYNILYTQGNFNNSIGVPKTVLGLRPEHQLAVIEMGASHPGDIAELVNVSEPDYGIITNVGRAHLLGFGSFEGVIRTKGELYDFIREHGGKVFINGKNPYLAGISNGLDLIKYADNGNFISCDPFLRFRWEGTEVQTRLVGAYNIDNVLAAATIGRYFGVSHDDICSALEDYTPSNNRSQFVQTERNRLIIDAYNANPTSMAAALENFRQMQMPDKIAILGDMGELGEVSQQEHIKIVNWLSASGMKAYLTGKEFTQAVAAVGAQFTCFPDVEALRAFLADNAVSGQTVLIKGSNSTRLYTLADMF